MNILYFFNNFDSMMFQWQRFHIINEMKVYGVNIDILSPLDYESKEEANQRLLEKIKSYDLFMTGLTEEDLFKDTIREIKRMGIPTLLLCPDNLVAPFNHRTIAALFDLVWLTSSETEYLFKRWGCNTVFLPYAANPFFLKPDYSLNEDACVGFIGTPHGSRIDRINKLINAEIPVCVHANQNAFDQGFIKAPISDYLKKVCKTIRYPIGIKLMCGAVKDKLYHRQLVTNSDYLIRKNPVPLAELSMFNCKYGLVLSFTEADSTGVLKKPVPIVNLRNFEIPMSGGLQFARYSEELASYFEDDKEIILCRNDEEFVSKAKYYLKEEQTEKRQKMRLAARKRAEQEHTWQCRFTNVFRIMGI